jgi:hypothetical protein
MAMYSSKILLAAAALAVSSQSGTANAAPWDRQSDFRPDPAVRHEFSRPIVERVRVFDTLSFHHYRRIGDPHFVRGHYVVRGINPFGQPVFVEVDPYTGAFIGEFRI